MTITPATTDPSTTFRTLKAELDHMNSAYRSGGAVSYDDLRAKAVQAAEVANAEITRVARSLGRRPRLVTAAGLLR